MITSVVLLLSNLLLAAIIWFRPPPKHPNNKELIIEQLHFDGQQQQAYLETVHRHQQSMRNKEEQLMALQQHLYQQLRSNQPENTDSITTQIAAIGKEMELIHYHHFEEIKQLCRPEQMVYFNELSEHLSDMFHPRPHHK